MTASQCMLHRVVVSLLRWQWPENVSNYGLCVGFLKLVLYNTSKARGLFLCCHAGWAGCGLRELLLSELLLVSRCAAAVGLVVRCSRHRRSLSVVARSSTVGWLGIIENQGVRFMSGIFQHLSGFQCSAKRANKVEFYRNQVSRLSNLVGWDHRIVEYCYCLENQFLSASFSMNLLAISLSFFFSLQSTPVDNTFCLLFQPFGVLLLLLVLFLIYMVCNTRSHSLLLNQGWFTYLQITIVSCKKSYGPILAHSRFCSACTLKQSAAQNSAIINTWKTHLESVKYAFDKRQVKQQSFLGEKSMTFRRLN